MINVANTFKMPRSLSALLQQIEHFVARGSVFYVSGDVTVDKVLPLTSKFAERYPVLFADANDRTAAKRLGVPRVNLFWWPNVRTGLWTFWLLSDQPLPDERMHDCRKSSKRIVAGVFTQYRNARRPGGSWTWELTEASYSYWRRQLLGAATKGNGRQLQQRIKEILRLYMAGYVRRQVWELLQEADRKYAHARQLTDVGMKLIVPERIVKARRLSWYSRPPVTLGEALRDFDADRNLILVEGTSAAKETFEERVW